MPKKKSKKSIDRMPRLWDTWGMTKSKKAKKQGFISVGGLPQGMLSAIREDAKRNQRSVAGEVRALLIEALAAHGYVPQEVSK